MEIKDYLHLYIGCEAKVLIQYQQSGSQWVNCKLVGIDNGIPKVRPRDIFGNDWDEDTLRNEVKPILRRLSDMTEEEKARCIQICLGYVSLGHNRNWSGKYSIYVSKDGVDLWSCGGEETAEDAIKKTLNYLKSIKATITNGSKPQKYAPDHRN